MWGGIPGVETAWVTNPGGNAARSPGSGGHHLLSERVLTFDSKLSYVSMLCDIGHMWPKSKICYAKYVVYYYYR